MGFLQATQPPPPETYYLLQDELEERRRQKHQTPEILVFEPSNDY